MKKFIISNCVIVLLVLTVFCFPLSLSSRNTKTIPLSPLLDQQVTDPDTRAFITCINQTSVIFTPNNSSFEQTWLFSVANLRFANNLTRKPSVIVTPFNAQQVQTALHCTKKNGFAIRIRSGGHDFEGLSYTDNVPFVLIDFYNMRKIDIDVESETAWVETGAVLGEMYYAVSQKTDSLAFTGGLCPTVGIGGFVGGGGYGNLFRKYGLAADNVVDVRFIDVNGNLLDKSSMGEDLFWAIRGGGASSFGIVLAWKLRLVRVPERITTFTAPKTLEENATNLFYKYQFVGPFLEKDLLLRVAISTVNASTEQKTVQVSFTGVYQGKTDSLLSILNEKFPELGVTRDMCEEVRTVESYVASSGYDIATTPVSILANRSAFAKQAFKGTSDYIRDPIPLEGIERIFAKFLEDDGTGLVSIFPFGGRMGEISESSLPYPHRAGVLFQLSENAFFTDANSTDTILRRLRWLNELHNDVLKPYVSKNPREAYYNYIDLDIGVGKSTYEEASEWGERYWKDNFKRLIEIKKIVDPQNFFRHPQSIPVFA